NTERIDVSLRHVPGWLRERFVAELARCFRPEHVRETLLLRRIGVRTRARTLERIAALLDRPAQIAGLPASAAEIFERVVVGLEVVVGDAPILNRHVFRQEGGAVTLREVRAQDEIARQEAPGLRIPVHAAAADAVRRHERAPAADRERGL